LGGFPCASFLVQNFVSPLPHRCHFLSARAFFRYSDQRRWGYYSCGMPFEMGRTTLVVSPRLPGWHLGGESFEGCGNVPVPSLTWRGPGINRSKLGHKAPSQISLIVLKLVLRRFPRPRQIYRPSQSPSFSGRNVLTGSVGHVQEQSMMLRTVHATFLFPSPSIPSLPLLVAE
jgi:hypothetical protein